MGDHRGKNRAVTENVIRELAQQLGDAGTFVGRNLGISDPAIACIQRDHHGNLKEINYQILLKWKRKSGSKATKARLVLALKKCHRTDLAERYLKGLSAKKGITKGAETKAKTANLSKDNKEQKKPVSKRSSTSAGSSSAKKVITKGAEKKAKNAKSSKDNKEKKMPVSKSGSTPAGGSLDRADYSERMDNLQLFITESQEVKTSKLAWTSEKQNIIRPLKKNTCDGFINIFAHGRWPEDVTDVSINITVKEENTREIGTLSSESRALYYDFSDKGLQDVIKSAKLIIKPNYRFMKEKATLQETSAIKCIPNQQTKIPRRSGLTSPACVQVKQDDQQNTSSLLSSSSCKKRKKSSDSETPETEPYKDGVTVPASRRLRLSESVKNSETPRRITRSLSKVSPPADCAEDRPSERWGHTMCVTGPDTVTVVGGQGAHKVISEDALWELNSSTSTWSVPEVEQLVPRPELRTGHTMTRFLNLVYVFGGSDNITWYNDVFVLDLSDKKWSYIDAGGNAPRRAYHTSTFFRGDMFVFGGIHPNPYPKPDSCSNDLFIFSLESNHWYKPPVLGPKPKPRSGHSATLLGDKLVIFGGWDEPVCFNDVYILDLSKRLMKFSSPVVEGKAPSPRSWHASCALSDNRVLIHGGYNGNNALSDAFVFSLDALRWKQVTLEGSGPVGARAGHTICAIPDGETDKIVMFGGGDNENNFFNDLLLITAN